MKKNGWSNKQRRARAYSCRPHYSRHHCYHRRCCHRCHRNRLLPERAIQATSRSFYPSSRTVYLGSLLASLRSPVLEHHRIYSNLVCMSRRPLAGTHNQHSPTLTPILKIIIFTINRGFRILPVLGDIVDGSSLGCFCTQTFFNEAKSARSFARHYKLALGDLFHEPVIVAALERHRAIDERV